MGSICSTNAPVEASQYFTREDESKFLQIGIDYKDLQKFAALFNKFDPTMSSELDLVEFLIDVHLEINIMTIKIFNLLDGHNDNFISFFEFVLHSWFFLTMTSKELERFAFEIYNSSGSGKLNKKELTDVLVKIHGKKHVEAKLASILELMDIDHSHGIDVDEFLGHIRQFPVLMFPVFSIQDTMRQYILGESFWQAKEEKALKYKQHPVVKEMLKKSFSHKHLHNVAPIKGHHLGSNEPEVVIKKRRSNDEKSTSRSKTGGAGEMKGTNEGQAGSMAQQAGAGGNSPRRHSVTNESQAGSMAQRAGAGGNSPRRHSTAGLSPRSGNIPSDTACAPKSPRRQSLTGATEGGHSHQRHHHEVASHPKGHGHGKHHHDPAPAPSKNAHAHAGPQVIKYGH